MSRQILNEPTAIEKELVLLKEENSRLKKKLNKALSRNKFEEYLIRGFQAMMVPGPSSEASAKATPPKQAAEVHAKPTRSQAKTTKQAMT